MIAAALWWPAIPTAGETRFGVWLARRGGGRPEAARPPAAGEVGLLRRRDPDAWRAVFEREMPAIYRYALSRLGRAEEAEDATSAVFEQAWASAERLEDQGLPVRAWLFGIARHVVVSHRRRWLRRLPELSLDALETSVDGVPDASELDLARAIASLSRRHTEVIALRFIHGLSLEETAAVLRSTVNAVKGRQARALAELRQALAAERESASHTPAFEQAGTRR